MVRLDGVLYQGRIDRLVLVQEKGQLARAEILDFKTDRFGAGDDAEMRHRSAEYRGQMEVYRRAVAGLFSLPLSGVRATLVFLAPGRLATLPSE